MSNTNWIEMAKQKPTEADAPVWAESPRWHEPEKLRLFWRVEDLLDARALPARNWKPAKADIPPPPAEPTQRERDNNSLIMYSLSKGPLPQQCFEFWHAALAWERAEIMALVKQHIDAGQSDWLTVQLRARCTPAK